MSDIVERLRKLAATADRVPIFADAAAEVERLDELIRQTGKLLISANAEIERLRVNNDVHKVEIERLRAHTEALQDKINLHDCACSYDNADDVCMTHSPTVERLRSVLRPLLEHYRNCYNGNEDQLAKDARAALEGRK